MFGNDQSNIYIYGGCGWLGVCVRARNMLLEHIYVCACVRAAGRACVRVCVCGVVCVV